MSTLRVMDRDYLDIVRSSMFVDRARAFLQNDQRLGDTGIRIIRDDALQQHAQNFCARNLGHLFPDKHRPENFDADLICEEVLNIYRDLKAELLNKSRLGRPLESIISWELATSTNEPDSFDLSTLIARESSKELSLRSRRGRRHRREHKVKRRILLDELELDRKTEDKVESLDSKESMIQRKHTTQSSPSKVDMAQLSPESLQIDNTPEVVLSECLPAFKMVDHGDFIEQVKRLKEENAKLQSENRKLNDHQKFVENTLRLCQDTYLEQAQSARRVGIYQLAAQCKVVVDALRDVQSDVDFEYFKQYTLLNGYAPPSRYWIEGTRKLRQKNEIFRS